MEGEHEPSLANDGGKKESNKSLAKHGRLTTALVPIVLLAVLLLQPPVRDSVMAAPFADNFDDLNYNGWSTLGAYFDWTSRKLYPLGAGNFSAADATLKGTGPLGNTTGEYASVAYTSSSVDHGTWSFDLFVLNTTLGFSYVSLIADHYNPEIVHSGFPGPYMNNSYEIWVYTRDLRPRINIDRPMITLEGYATSGIYPHGYGSWPFLDSSATWTNCWTHFDVTRDSTGHFNVYVNGTLRISVSEPNNPIPTGYFMFHGQSGQAIDNVSVSDHVIPPTTVTVTTTTTAFVDSPLSTLMMAVGIIELIVIVVLGVLFFRRRP
jgi:hypothetical protein